MKIAMIADLHFSSYSNDKVISKSGLTERLDGLNNALYDVISYCLNNLIYVITILGDVFHNKNLIHATGQSVLLDIIRDSKNIDWIILDGNHDMSDLTGNGVPATKCLDNESNVTTIHKTTMIENMLFVPWNPKNMIDDIKHGKSEYLMAHLGLNEGVLNSGISLVSDIGLKDLKQYKKAYFGHYHIPQEVGNVVYIGSSTHLDWNDKNQEKRFVVFNSKTGEEKYIPTTGYKKYLEFNITKDNKDEILSKVRDLKTGNNTIKLIKTDDLDLSEYKNDFEIIDKQEKDITHRGITSTMTRSDKLDRFLEIKEIPQDKRDKYKNIALEIMESSLS